MVWDPTRALRVVMEAYPAFAKESCICFDESAEVAPSVIAGALLDVAHQVNLARCVPHGAEE